jgi:hypothetical protein
MNKGLFVRVNPRGAALAFLVAALALGGGCATPPRRVGAKVGRILVLPPAGPRGVYEVFTRSQFEELIREIHETAEARGWICVKPISKFSFPLMQSFFFSSYRHKPTDMSLDLRAECGSVAILFRTPARPIEGSVTLTQEEILAMNDALTALTHLLKSRHPEYQLEIETVELRRSK